MNAQIKAKQKVDEFAGLIGEYVEEIKRLTRERDQYLSSLRGARRTLRKIKRETGKHDAARELCVAADRRATAAISRKSRVTGASA